MADAKGVKLYTEKDMVDVVDELGNELPAVPKSWIGTDLVPAGVKKADGKATGGSTTPADPTVEPSKSGTKADWVAFAKATKAAEDADLVDEQGKALTRDALVEKYGSQAPAATGSSGDGTGSGD